MVDSQEHAFQVSEEQLKLGVEDKQKDSYSSINTETLKIIQAHLTSLTQYKAKKVQGVVLPYPVSEKDWGETPTL